MGGEITLKTNTTMVQKKIWRLLLIIGILSSIINGCGKTIVERLVIRSYEYTNETNYSISIEDWKTGTSQTFDLNPAKKITFQVELGVSGNCKIDGIRSRPSNCLLIWADSLKISFDNEKTLVLKQNDSRDINILKEENYNYEKDGIIEKFKYSFTQKDYEQAN